MSKLTIDQTKVLEAIRYFCDKFEEAYPSIPKIAAMAGMCTRKCSDIIRGLVEMGRLIRIKRWMKSNMYQIVDPDPVKEETPAVPKTENADYKRSYKSFKKSFNKITNDDVIYESVKSDFLKFGFESIITEVQAKLPMPLHLYHDTWILKALRHCHAKIRNREIVYNAASLIAKYIRELKQNHDIRTSSAPVRT